MNISHHCEERLQQRAIPSIIVNILLDHGKRVRHRGADVVYVDKQARKEIRRALGGDRNMRTIEPWLDTYVVVSDDGTLITAARRTCRLQRV